MLIALFVIGIIGRIVRGHHMFIVGFDIDTRSHSTTATSITAIPTGIKILNWLATMWSACYLSTTPISFIIGFLSSSSFGGFTGPILANCMIDTLSHDPYSIVGHLHYVPSLGAVHTFFAGFYHYILFFKANYSSNEFIGRIHFTILSISPNPIFFSMHLSGITGFPRRIFDYPVIYFRYHRSNTFGIIGIMLSLIYFISSVAIGYFNPPSLSSSKSWMYLLLVLLSLCSMLGMIY